MNRTVEIVVSIAVAIITLATISVIISKRSRAPEAIRAVATGLANVVSAAVNPQSNQGSI